MDYRTSQGRLFVWGSDVLMVLAGLSFVFARGERWSWGPFLVGLAVGALALSAYAGFLRIAIAYVRPDVQQLDSARTALHQRNRVVIPNFITFGLLAGLISGGLRSYWPDLALAAMDLVGGVLLPLALLPFMQRRAAAKSNPSLSQ